MGILREIIARFSVSVDDKDLKKLDKSLATTRENLDKVATQGAVAFAALGYGAFELVSMASDATEQLNVIQQAFGDNGDAVLMWSDKMSKALGRSKYDLQNYAGQFGSFLEPLFKGTDQDIAGMSEQLSGLAVDLASFYNKSESESMMRLFSGLSGETEAVRRLGIDISDDALTEFNTKQSGGKDTRHSRNLNLREKTALRFQKIMADTVAKQGDAVRTADELANTTKRVTGQLHDLGVEAGKKLVPIVKDLFGAFEEYLLPAVTELAEESNVMQHAFELAGGAAGALAISFGLANKAALANALILGGLLLAFDDLRGGAEGAKTAMDAIAGKEEGDKTSSKDLEDKVISLLNYGSLIPALMDDLSALGLTSGKVGGKDAFGFVNVRQGLESIAADEKQRDLLDASRAGSLDEAKRRAIEARDPIAYANAFKSTGTVRPDDQTAAYLRDTKRDYEAGNTSHYDQDVANGVALPGTKGHSIAGDWRNAGRTNMSNLLQTGAIQINMYGDNNEKKVADHLGVMLRQTAAVIGDEKSGAKK